MSDAFGSFYKLSGKFPPYAPAATLAVAGGVGVVAGAVYGVLVLLVPFIYINFIGTCGLGFLVGWLTSTLAMKTRIRNTPVAALSGFLAGLAALYASWVGWIYALSDYEYVILSPVELFADLAPALAEEGLWGFGDTMVRGWALYGVWALEALIILGCATFYPASTIGALAFDEDRGAWALERLYLPPFEALDDERLAQMRERLKRGEFEALAELQPAAEGAMAFTQFEIAAAEESAEKHFLTVRGITVTVDRDGDPKSESEMIAQNLIIDANTRQVLTELGEPGEGEADAPEAATETDPDTIPLDNEPTA